MDRAAQRGTEHTLGPRLHAPHAQELALIKALLEAGQAHLFAAWPAPGTQVRHSQPWRAQQAFSLLQLRARRKPGRFLSTPRRVRGACRDLERALSLAHPAGRAQAQAGVAAHVAGPALPRRPARLHPQRQAAAAGLQGRSACLARGGRMAWDIAAAAAQPPSSRCNAHTGSAGSALAPQKGASASRRCCWWGRRCDACAVPPRAQGATRLRATRPACRTASGWTSPRPTSSRSRRWGRRGGGAAGVGSGGQPGSEQRQDATRADREGGGPIYAATPPCTAGGRGRVLLLPLRARSGLSV